MGIKRHGTVLWNVLITLSLPTPMVGSRRGERVCSTKNRIAGMNDDSRCDYVCPVYIDVKERVLTGAVGAEALR